MRRIVSVLTIIAIMTAMVVAAALPAFAQGKGPGDCPFPPGQLVKLLTGPGTTPPKALQGTPGEATIEVCGPGIH